MNKKLFFKKMNNTECQCQTCRIERQAKEYENDWRREAFKNSGLERKVRELEEKLAKSEIAANERKLHSKDVRVQGLVDANNQLKKQIERLQQTLQDLVPKQQLYDAERDRDKAIKEKNALMCVIVELRGKS